MHQWFSLLADQTWGLSLSEITPGYDPLCALLDEQIWGLAISEIIPGFDPLSTLGETF